MGLPVAYRRTHSGTLKHDVDHGKWLIGGSASVVSCFFCLQTIDKFGDSVTSVVITSSEIIGGSVDGTVRTFDIRVGRSVGT